MSDGDQTKIHVPDDAYRHWWRVGFAMFAVGFGANHFIPLLQVYREGMASSEASLTAMVGVYAAGLIPALLYFGRLSDQIGRKSVLMPGLWVALVGTLILALGAFSQEWPLYLGRIIIGVSVGMGMACGAAWIKQLSTDDPVAGPRRATVAVSAGFGLGPLISGVIAEFAPAPDFLPYVIHAAVTLCALWWLRAAPETQEGRGVGKRKIVPPVVFTAAYLLAIVAWAPWTFGAPTTAFVTNPSQIGIDSAFPTLVQGLLAFLTMFSSLFIQPVVAKLLANGPRWLALAALGLTTTAAGLGVAVAAALTGSVWLMLITAPVLGTAYGIFMVAGLAETERFADDGELGALVGIFYSLTYLGFFVPFLISMLVTGAENVFGMDPTQAYVGVLAVGVVVCLASIWPVSKAAGYGGRS
ncbi:MFS transporter [Corynebacterium yudongzhengii]|nr:MFS transporter [Corynebacterium yudongzhengii]